MRVECVHSTGHWRPLVKVRILLTCLILMTVDALPGMRAEGGVQHNLPDNLEIVDPKSLGLGDGDLEKFLGNVKVLSTDGRVNNNVKTEILTVGFDGNEKLNLADFDGLTTDGLPDHEKQVAQAAFQRFQDFFRNPGAGQNFDEPMNRNHGGGPQNLGQPGQNLLQGQNRYQEPQRAAHESGQRAPYHNRDLFRPSVSEPQMVGTPGVVGNHRQHQQQQQQHQQQQQQQQRQQHHHQQHQQQQQHHQPLYRMNPQEISSLLTATEATTRTKAPQVYSLKESAFPTRLAQLMGIGTSIERPRPIIQPHNNAPPPQNRPQHQPPTISQPLHITAAPMLGQVHSHRTPGATHNPSFNYQAVGNDLRATHAPQLSGLHHHHHPGGTRYTATPSIPQSHYVPNLVQGAAQQQQQQPQHLPAPQGTYKPPQSHPQNQQPQHPYTYHTQNYDLQPSIGFQVPAPLAAPSHNSGPISSSNRGTSGQIDPAKSHRLTGHQIFQHAAASSHNPVHPPQQQQQQQQQNNIQNNPHNQHSHSQQQKLGQGSTPTVSSDREKYLRALKEAAVAAQKPKQHFNPNNYFRQQQIQTAMNQMLAQLHIHMPNQKHPTILNIHQDQPQSSPTSSNHHQHQVPFSSNGQHQHQQELQPHHNHHPDSNHGQITNTLQHQHAAQSHLVNNHQHFRQNNNHHHEQQQQQQQPSASHQRPSGLVPTTQNTYFPSASATPAPHASSLGPPVLIATPLPQLHRPSSESHRNGRDHKIHSFHHQHHQSSNAIQGAPSHHHPHHLLPLNFPPTSNNPVERQRETPQRPPAPPPHPPPPAIPYRNYHNGQVDVRAPRTLAEASLPRRYSYEEWPLHRSDDDVSPSKEQNGSIENHIESSVDLLEGGSEQALAITQQLFDPEMIEAIQPAQMIAYGHMTSSEKPGNE